MYEPMSDAVWFYWPVTVAMVTAMNVRHLVRRRAFRSAALGVLAAALPVAPLMLNMRVRCGEDGQRLDDLVGSGYVLGASLFAVVGWLAILYWLRVRAGDERAAADRTTLWSAAVVAMGIPIEAVFSFSSMEGYCYGNGSERAAHLTVALVVLLAGAATGLARSR